MKELMRWVFLLASVIGFTILNGPLSAQTSSTVMKVLDPSEVEGIAGVMLLINPGDSRKSQALVTDTKGEAIASHLDCLICTITAFDPRGSFVSRTTEFSGSTPLFRIVLAIQPLLDIVGDPQAVSTELAINDPKGQPLVQHRVVIRPAVMTLQNNRVSVQNTDSAGHVKVRLRGGDYTVGALDEDVLSEARFEIATAKKQCSSGKTTCIVAPPQSNRRMKAIRLQLSLVSARTSAHEPGKADPKKQ